MVSSGGRGVTGGGSSGRVTPGSHRGPSRGRWDLGAGDAESVLAEARKALFVMAGFLAVIWVLQIATAKPAPVTGATGGLNFPGTQPGMSRKLSDPGSPAR